MTVASEVSDTDQAGNGVTVAFSIPFDFLSNSDIEVAIRNSSGDSTVITTGFSVAGAGTGSGTCTFDVAPASGTFVVITRAPQFHQPMDLSSNDSFPAETVERSFDRGTYISQYLRQLVNRSLRLPAGDPSTGDAAILPGVSERRGMLLGFADTSTAPPEMVVLADVDGVPLSQSVIAALLNPQTDAEDDGGVTPTDNVPPEGDLRRYGGVGDGTTDDSAALQSACDVGVVIVPNGYSFKILTGATRTGKLIYKGQGGKLLCDSTVIDVTDGTDSEICGFNAENITAPWIITRDPSDWGDDISGTLAQSNDDGYQPTINDQDLWAGLTTPQQNQQIGPTLNFSGDASNIRVKGVRGRFVNININDAQDSSVEDVDVRGGKGATAAVTFWNINSQVGRRNWARNIRVRYSSFCSVVFARNFDGGVSDVTSYRNGESGVKFWKGDIGPTDARCYNMQVRGVHDVENYFDGPDLAGDYPPASTHAGHHLITDVQSYGCGGTGLNIDGSGHTITSVRAWNCGRAGIWASELANSVLTHVYLAGNVIRLDAGQHDLMMDGASGCIVQGVRVEANATGQYAVYAPDGVNTFANVSTTGAGPFFGNVGSINSILINIHDGTGSPSIYNARVGNRYFDDDSVGIQAWPRSATLDQPSMSLDAFVADGTPGAHTSWLYLNAAYNGDLVEAMRAVKDGAINKHAVGLSAPNSAPDSAMVANGMVMFYLDESGHNLKVKVKYADGTVKTGTLAVS